MNLSEARWGGWLFRIDRQLILLSTAWSRGAAYLEDCAKVFEIPWKVPTFPDREGPWVFGNDVLSLGEDGHPTAKIWNVYIDWVYNRGGNRVDNAQGAWWYTLNNIGPHIKIPKRYQQERDDIERQLSSGILLRELSVSFGDALF